MNGRRIYNSRREVYQERISAIILLVFYTALILLALVALWQFISFDDVMEGVDTIAIWIDENFQAASLLLCILALLTIQNINRAREQRDLRYRYSST